MDLAHPIASVIPGLPGRVLGVLGRTETPLTGRAVARAMTPPGSQAGVAKVLDTFVRDGIVLRSEAGASATFVLNREHLVAPLVEGLAELRTTFLDRLAAAVADLRPPALSAYLYGSAARGDGDVTSDIDIALVVSDAMTTSDAWDAATAGLRQQVHAMTGNDVSLVEYRLRELFGTHDQWAVTTLDREGIRLVGATVGSLRRRWQALDMRTRHAAVLGRARLLAGEPADAIDPLVRAREAYRALGDDYGEASTLRDLSDAYATLSRWEDAAEALAAAKAIYHTLGDVEQEAGTTALHARALTATGRHQDAVDAFRNALAIGGGVTDEWRGRVHASLAGALAAMGDIDAARREGERGVSLLRSAGAVSAEADALLSHAGVLAEVDADAALAAAVRARSLFGDMGDEGGVARSSLVLGLIRAERGEVDDARSLFQQSLALFQRVDDQRNEALASWFLGDLVRDVEMLRAAADRFRRLEDSRSEAMVLEAMGDTYADSGNVDRALDAYREALDAFRRTGDTKGTLSALQSLERIHALRAGRTAS